MTTFDPRQEQQKTLSKIQARMFPATRATRSFLTHAVKDGLECLHVMTGAGSIRTAVTSRDSLSATPPESMRGGESEDEPAAKETHPDAEKEPLPEWPEGVNPETGEKGGPKGPEPSRFGDWERKGRVSDF